MLIKRVNSIINQIRMKGLLRYLFYTFSLYNPYIKYLYDKFYYSFGKISYYNFWPLGESDFWISKFIYKKRGVNIISNRLNFISVFGPRKNLSYIKGKKIFFTGEDIGKNSILGFEDYDDYLLDDVDLSIGFRDYSVENYIRFPLWIMQLVDPGMTYEDIKKRIDYINDRNFKSRGKFCTLIARHDRKGERENIYRLLIKINNVDCPSTLFHNMDVDLPDYESKRKFMENYCFNLCLENHSVNGYVTEKLIDSFLSKCIPIYNGILTDFDKQIINEDAIINTLDKNWLNKIKEIYGSDKKYKEFISIKPFKKDAALIISKHLDLLYKKLIKVLIS